MNDKIGQLPSLKNKNHAFREIITITKDKRTHVLSDDALHWMEVKMKAIRLLAIKGLRK